MTLSLSVAEFEGASVGPEDTARSHWVRFVPESWAPRKVARCPAFSGFLGQHLTPIRDGSGLSSSNSEV